MYPNALLTKPAFLYFQNYSNFAFCFWSCAKLKFVKYLNSNIYFLDDTLKDMIMIIVIYIAETAFLWRLNLSYWVINCENSEY